MGVSIKIDSRFTELFDAFSSSNKVKFLTALGDLELSKTKKRFIDQVDPENRPWVPTVRKALDPSARILRKSSNLFNSITRQVQGNSVFIGTNVQYAETHQNGATIRPVTSDFLRFKIGTRWFSKKEVVIPQRRFIGINDETGKSIEEAFQTIMRKILT